MVLGIVVGLMDKSYLEPWEPDENVERWDLVPDNIDEIQALTEKALDDCQIVVTEKGSILLLRLFTVFPPLGQATDKEYETLIENSEFKIIKQLKILHSIFNYFNLGIDNLN